MVADEVRAAGIVCWKFVLLRSLPFFLILAAPLAADEFWSWHTFDYPVLATGRWSALIHGRLHFGYGKPAQGRIGPVARYSLTPRLSLIAGYYFSEEHDPYDWKGPWATSHRPFGGVEAALTSRRWARLAARGLAERYFVYDKPDYFRYRARLRYTTAARLSPVAMIEPFYDAKGLLSVRYSGGFRVSLTSARALEIVYTYDRRRQTSGTARHIIQTHYVFGGRR